MNKFINMEIVQTGFWMDGGTMTIDVRLENSEKVCIEFVQKMTMEITPEGKYPGQLYLDSVHVEPRSQLENNIIEGLKIVSVLKGVFPGTEKDILDEKIQYLEAEKYLEDYKLLKTNYMKR